MELIKNFWSGIRAIIIPEKAANWKVIILCLLGATTFWFFNALNKSYTTSINYPVSFGFDRSQYIPLSKLPEQIQINVTGGGWDLLRRASWFNIKPLEIPLADPLEPSVSANSYRALISERLDEFQLNFIVTDSLHFNIDKLINKKMRLVIDSTNASLADDYYMVSPITQSYDSADFLGPSSMVEYLPDSFLIKIPENDIDEDYNGTVQIETGSDDLFKVTPPAIDISFQVRKFVRESQEVQAELLNFPSDSSWFVEDPMVQISYLTRSDKPETDSLQFEVFLDLKRMVLLDSTIQPIIKDFPKNVLDIRIESGRTKISHE